jgi:DNA ligase-associated metallophosphoesterase
MPLNVEVSGITLELHPERALFWPEAKTLVMADLHFGKDQYFRKAGIPVPQGLTHFLLHQTRRLIERISPNRVLILGDFWHHRSAVSEDVDHQLMDWTRDYPELPWSIIPGNHDRHLRDWESRWNLKFLDEIVVEPPFSMTHDATMAALSTAGHYCLAGHLHPAAQLRAPGFPPQKLPCFWFGQQRCILPAFNPFTGLNLQKFAPNDRLGVIADDEVILWNL